MAAPRAPCSADARSTAARSVAGSRTSGVRRTWPEPAVGAGLPHTVRRGRRAVQRRGEIGEASGAGMDQHPSDTRRGCRRRGDRGPIADREGRRWMDHRDPDRRQGIIFLNQPRGGRQSGRASRTDSAAVAGRVIGRLDQGQRAQVVAPGGFGHAPLVQAIDKVLLDQGDTFLDGVPRAVRPRAAAGARRRAPASHRCGR